MRFADRLRGIWRRGDAVSAVMAGVSPVLVATSASSQTLSMSSRDLVRDLRSAGTRVEFHTPGEAGALLQAVNRLLADIPLESLGKSAEAELPRLLIIDDAEGLSIAETASLKRIANGLRGSALRILLLVKTDASQLVLLPLTDLAELATLWDLDASAEDASDEEEPVPGPILDATERPPAPVAVDPPAIGSVSDTPIPDVLTELARERAAALGFDATRRTSSMRSIVTATVAAMGVLLVVFFIYDAMTERRQAPPKTFDCGLHPDRESMDVLLARIPRATPTRVVTEGERLRLLVGPFPDAAAADVVRAQLWRMGSCSPKPVVPPVAVSNTRKMGG
jgi:hypothetical protein